MTSPDPPDEPKRKRRPVDPYEFQEKIVRWVLGGFAAGLISILLGLAATPFFLEDAGGLYLWFLAVPGFVAPAVGFLVWFLVRFRHPHAGRGAVVFGTVSFLLTATCWAALSGMSF